MSVLPKSGVLPEILQNIHPRFILEVDYNNQDIVVDLGGAICRKFVSQLAKKYNTAVVIDEMPGFNERVFIKVKK